jgi:hypothetical protein
MATIMMYATYAGANWLFPRIGKPVSKAAAKIASPLKETAAKTSTVVPNGNRSSSETDG